MTSGRSGTQFFAPEIYAFKSGKATTCHVKISADYSALAAKVNATFTADLFGDGPVKANPA